jgi:carboxymethylenebutenolidase
MTTRTVYEDTPLQVAGAPESPRGLVVIQEAFGVNDHIRAVAEYYASQGYYAVAPELFHRAGSPEIPYDDFPSAMGILADLNPAGLEADLRAAVGFLHDAGFARETIGIVGYCMGGSVTLFAATLGITGAAATYYGGGVANGRFGLAPLIEQAPHLDTPWMGFYGDRDKGIPVEEVEALRAAAATAPVPTEIVRYPDADHGFHCDGRPAVYNAADAADARARTLAFFEATLATKAP